MSSSYNNSILVQKEGEGGGGGLIVDINESDIYVAYTYNTSVVRGQRSRSKVTPKNWGGQKVNVKVNEKKKGGLVGCISFVFVKSMKCIGELLQEGEVGPFWGQYIEETSKYTEDIGKSSKSLSLKVSEK